MGIKLENAAHAVDWLREQAWKSVEVGKGNRAERLHFCADLLAEMQQEIGDLEDLTAELMEEPTAVSARISTLLEAHERLDARLGPGRGPIADAAHDVIDSMYEEAVFAATGDIPHLCDCPSCPGIYASALQEADRGPSLGSRLPVLPESEMGPVAASGDQLADFMIAMQYVVDRYAEHLSSVEIVGAMEMVKDEALEVTRLGIAERLDGLF